RPVSRVSVIGSCFLAPSSGCRPPYPKTVQVRAEVLVSDSVAYRWPAPGSPAVSEADSSEVWQRVGPGTAVPAAVPPPSPHAVAPASTASTTAATRMRIRTVPPSVAISLTTWSDAGQGGLVAILRSLTANGRKVLRLRALSATDSIQSRCEDSWRT